MKQIVLIFAISTAIFSCKSKTNNGLATDKNAVLTDTALLHRSGILSDTASRAKATAVPNAKGTTTVSSTTTTVTTTTSGNGVIAPVKTSSVSKPSANRSTANRSKRSSSGTTRSNDNSGAAENSAPAPVQRDKGWSSAAKGTAIGAGSGAVLGAVLAKDKVKGAVIGGVIGGAGGYAIGRDRDRKSGRVARARARKQQQQ